MTEAYRQDRRKVAGILLYCWWNMWKERNRRVFDNVKQNEFQVASTAKEDIDNYWIARNNIFWAAIASHFFLLVLAACEARGVSRDCRGVCVLLSFVCVFFLFLSAPADLVYGLRSVWTMFFFLLNERAEHLPSCLKKIYSYHNTTLPLDWANPTTSLIITMQVANNELAISKLISSALAP
jgi:hypothetical protein